MAKTDKKKTKTSLNVAKSKAKRKNTVSTPTPKNRTEETPQPKTTKKKVVSKEPRKLVRIQPQYHELAKWNEKKMQLQVYIEALIQLDRAGAVNWKKYED